MLPGKGPITHPDMYFINQLRNNRNEGDFWPIFRPGCGQAEFQQRQAMLPLVPNGSGWFQVESYMMLHVSRLPHDATVEVLQKQDGQAVFQKFE